ncbi:SHOCT domain-containing protein [Streptacidiphilus fuscans]|uniref:SHOCT domain-containing protein n=1 Tax=Streptacidiphilus fuscans TaxID=2789292 RepID=A0A931B1X2_9ACTN|nr:SHOCT domain-containing protein [Streptacidiphilus fuscans]MBF9068874.1 SHOCT domain-containing protein [Streptacidiphilus fuscans]
MSNYPLLNVFWTMLEFFLWILWFFLLFKVLADIFRSHDMGGWGKAGWIIFVIVLPFLGVLVYVIVRGRSMGERDMERAQQADAAFKQYVRDAAGTSGAAGAGGAAGTAGATASGGGASSGHVEDLAKLVDLKNSGALTEDEFQRAKAKLLA